jgi:glutathione S-transferase
MTYTLYYTPDTASTRSALASRRPSLQPWHSIRGKTDRFALKIQKDPSYLALKPKGRVPTLIIDGTPYTESAAMLMILAERHPDAHFAPVDPIFPAKWLETMNFLENTMSPAFRD